MGKTVDMTTGSPMKLIVGYTIPMLAGLLFQQFYNIVDTVIVGQRLGTDALAAVASTGSVSFLIVGFCIGICSGFAIPIAQAFGARDFSRLRRYIANAIYLSAVFSIVITAIVCLLTRQILTAMDTPENIIDDAYAYIFIIFLGIPVTFLYNMTAGIIRSLGDSKTPVYFLLMASVINIGLDLLFIMVLGTGVGGAAVATVISQLLSGIACLIYMIRKFPILKMETGEWGINTGCMADLCNMGIPMGLQYSITAIGSVILQTSVNSLGSDVVASVGAAGKINQFLMCPFDAMGSAMATYGGQNVGGRKLERLKTGLAACIKLGAGYSVIALLIVLIGGNGLLLLFIDAEETAILADAHYVMIANVSFFFMLALVNIVRFMIQGMGFSKFAMLAGVLEMIARAFDGIFLVPIFGLAGAAFASPLAWICADAFLIPAFFITYKKLEGTLELYRKPRKVVVHA